MKYWFTGACPRSRDGAEAPAAEGEGPLAAAQLPPSGSAGDSHLFLLSHRVSSIVMGSDFL